MAQHLASTRRGALLAACSIALVLASGGGTPALAAPAPPTATIAQGADGYLNAAEAAAVLVEGTYAPVDGTVSHVRATISVAADPSCPVVGGLGVDYLDPVNVPVDGLAGTWSTTFDVSSLPEGAALCARAVAFDGAYGDIGASVEQPVLDTIAPVTGAVEMIDDDGFLDDAQTTTLCCVPANWSTTEVDAVSASVWFRDADGALTAGCGPWGVGPSGFGAVNGSCATSMAQGAFEFIGTWSDAAGNVSPEATASLVKDTVGPVVVIAEPLDASAHGSTLTLTGTTAPGAPLSIEVDGVPVFTGAAAEDGTFSQALSLLDGAHLLSVLAEDELGNVGLDEVSVTIDSLIPTIDTPAPDSNNPAVVTFAGSGRPGSRVELLEGGVLVASAQVGSAGSWTVTAGLPSGVHGVRARGIALGGAQVSALGPVLSFTVDASRPSLAITTEDLSLFLLEPAVIDGTATDLVGVTRVRLEYVNALLGGKVLSADATCTGCGAAGASVTWTHSPSLAPGLYAVQATAIDGAGNRSTTEAIRFLVVAP